MTADELPSPFESLRVTPIGPYPEPLLRDVVAALSRVVRVPCRIANPPEPITLPLLPGRDQADADRTLELLEARARPGEALVGITRKDIGHPIFTHFFGRARHYGHALLVSTARLDPVAYAMPPDRALLLRRALRELLHELGHLGGLLHCDDPACLMNFSATVEGIDIRGDRFCASCGPQVEGFLRFSRAS